MPRWAAKVDGNQAEIVEALEKFGWTVISLARLGGGVPDLLCAKAWRTVLVEVKTDKGRLGSLQDSFRIAWPGELWVVRSVADVALMNRTEPRILRA
jgi:hypothetical protein